MRDERGRLRAFRNACRRRPHALVTARTGHLRRAIHCAAHSLTYGFDGRLVAGATPGDLTPLELTLAGGPLLVRAGGATGMRDARGDRRVRLGVHSPRWCRVA